MEFVNLGRAGVKVSRICLGCMTYGSSRWRPWVLDEEASRPFYRRAWEAGINFYDIAYGFGVAVAAPYWAVKSSARQKVLTAFSQRMGDVTRRQWPDDEWGAAVDRLEQRDWISAGTTLTPTGAAAKRRIEDLTDELATPPLAALEQSERERLVVLLGRLSRLVLDAGGVTFPNPIGLPDLRAQADT